MKRIFCFLMMSACLVFAANAQQVIIKGKYNGKMMTVKAQRAPGGDIIESVSYAPLDEMKTEVAKLKSQRDEWKQKYEKAIHDGPTDTTLIARMRRRLDAANAQLEEKEKDLEQLQNQLTTQLVNMKELQGQLQETQDAYEALKKGEVPTVGNDYKKDYDRVRDSLKRIQKQLDKKEKELATANDEINALKNRQRPGDELKGPEDFVVVEDCDMLSAEVFLGASYIYNNLTSQSFWARTMSGAQKYHLTFTHYFSSDKPLAMKVGLGMSSYHSQLSFNTLKDSTLNQHDLDGDIRNTYYNYHNVSEQVTLNYLDIPLMLHIGKSANYRGVQAWADLGFTVGLNVSKSFAGSGTYNADAYYPEWNVTIDNNPELGLFSDVDVYPDAITPKVNTIVVWANVAIGMYIPFNDKLGANIGARLDYSLTPLATNEEQEGIYLKGSPNTLSGVATRSFSAGVNLGLSFKF